MHYHRPAVTRLHLHVLVVQTIVFNPETETAEGIFDSLKKTDDDVDGILLSLQRYCGPILKSAGGKIPFQFNLQ